MGEEEKKGVVERFASWLDEEFGFTKTILRPPPLYSLKNPAYWLGALAVLAFFSAGVTGMIMLQFYEPHPDSAWESVSKIVSEVPFGNLIRNIHVYSAFSMVFITFLHFMRNYFVVAYRKPRELMWIIGMLMGIVTLLMGFTGYLLPWYALSYAAVGFGITIIKTLPPPLSGLMEYIVAGYGTDVELLRRFYAFHTVILPAALILLLALKMHIFEVHGITEPLSKNLPEEDEKPVPWFPEVLLYFIILSSVFIAVILTASIIHPFELHEKYTPGVVTIPMPEWYFMWTYAIAKTEFIEALGSLGFKLFVATLTLIALIFIFLPFIDRWKEKHPSERPFFIAIGVWIVVEMALMTYLAWITAGSYIPSEYALLSIFIPALIILAAAYLAHRRITKPPELVWEKFAKLRISDAHGLSQSQRAHVWTITKFMVMVMMAGFSTRLVTSAFTQGLGPLPLMGGAALFTLATIECLKIIYKADLELGNVKRRIAFLERGVKIG